MGGVERKWDNLEADLWELRCPERFRKNPGKVREKFRKLFQSRIFFFEENKREPKIEASTKKGEVCFWHLGEMASRLFFRQHFPEWPWHYVQSSHSLSERARFEPCTAKTVFFSFSLHLVVTKTHKVNVRFSITLVAQTMTMTSPKLTHYLKEEKIHRWKCVRFVVVIVVARSTCVSEYPT